MFYVKNMHLFGHLCGAEQTAVQRAKRDVEIVIGAPFGTHKIQRSLLPLKFYHDFDCDWDLCSYAFGPCWEPVCFSSSPSQSFRMKKRFLKIVIFSGDEMCR